jgi:gliding motility-associated-like protein
MYNIFAGLLMVLFLVSSCNLFAQKETSFWFDQYYALDFRTYPPKTLSIPQASYYQVKRATVADTEGNLLFYSDGVNCYDRRGQLMPNGKGISVTWGTTALPFVIAPVPGSETKYYLFTGRIPKSSALADYDWSLRYWIIDLELNGGYGDVIEKNVVIYPSVRDEFLLIKTPEDNAGFWLVCTPLAEADKLLAYRVSNTGIAAQPVVTPIQDGIQQAFWKASPDGKYMALRRGLISGTPKTSILKFDGSGGFNPFREIPSNFDANIFPSNLEFSPDSRFMYVMNDSTYYPSPNKIETVKTLMCFDLTAFDQQAFALSQKTIHKYEGGLLPVSTELQLTPQGKIVIGDVSQSGYFSVIHDPNACSIEEKNFELQAIPVPIGAFNAPPFFPSWYFHESNDFVPNTIGGDILVCPLEKVRIGKPPLEGYTYRWEPEPGLSDLSSANPEFQVPANITGSKDTTELFVTITDANACDYRGSVNVMVKAVDVVKVNGSKSVCPGVKEVKYWIMDPVEPLSIEWWINGGEIVGGQGTDTVFVNWGPSNPTASIGVISVNKNGCVNISQPFPVKVFKFLETETPNGKAELSCNDFIERYEIIGTNGSQYDWQLINGTILEGQGKSKVIIQWDKNYINAKVWINESVNTELETCFGRSDTLLITNPNQMLSQNVHFYNLSGTADSNDILEINYELGESQYYSNEIQLVRRSYPGEWQKAATTPSSVKSNLIPGQPLSEGVFEFRLFTFNICGDSAISEIHKNVFLTGESITDQNSLQLSWNPFDTWGSGTKEYQIMRKVDEQPAFELRAGTTSTSYQAKQNTDGFEHVIYVQAMSEDGKYSSISNKLTIAFEHQLFLPNVITPNDDQLNETWEPYPLELYQENKLQIFDRWGRLVFAKENYTGGWNGSDSNEGVFFYHLYTKRNNKAFKGFIQIIR